MLEKKKNVRQNQWQKISEREDSFSNRKHSESTENF